MVKLVPRPARVEPFLSTIDSASYNARPAWPTSGGGTSGAAVSPRSVESKFEAAHFTRCASGGARGTNTRASTEGPREILGAGISRVDAPNRPTSSGIPPSDVNAGRRWSAAVAGGGSRATAARSRRSRTPVDVSNAQRATSAGVARQVVSRARDRRPFPTPRRAGVDG